MSRDMPVTYYSSRFLLPRNTLGFALEKTLTMDIQSDACRSESSLLYLSVDKEKLFFLAFMAFKVKLTKIHNVRGNGSRFQVENIILSLHLIQQKLLSII